MAYFSINGERPPAKPSALPDSWAAVLILLSTLLIMLWLRHSGLHNYWQQTHHSDSGLGPFAASPVGQWGSRIDQQIQSPVSELQANLQQLDADMLKLSNGWLGVRESSDAPATQLASKPGKPAGSARAQAAAGASSQIGPPLRLTATPVLTKLERNPAANRPARAATSASSAVAGTGANAATASVDLRANPGPIEASATPEMQGTSQRRLPNGKILLRPNDKVLFIGDSMMQGVAPQAIRTLQRNYGIASVDASKQSTGLAYPRYFDWPKTVQELIPKHKITTLVVFIGANDTWDMVLNGRYEPFGTPRWRTMYSSRIRDILAFAKEKQVEVVWLGDPAMGKEKMNAGIPVLNSLYASVGAEFGIIYAPTDSVIGTGDGRYGKFIQNGERKIAMRTDDGVHFTPAGQVKLAELILQQFQLPATTVTQ